VLATLSPLTPLLHSSFLSFLFDETVLDPRSLPSLGVKGARPELESPVELAGLSLLIAKGFIGTVEAIGTRGIFLF